MVRFNLIIMFKFSAKTRLIGLAAGLVVAATVGAAYFGSSGELQGRFSGVTQGGGGKNLDLPFATFELNASSPAGRGTISVSEEVISVDITAAEVDGLYSLWTYSRMEFPMGTQFVLWLYSNTGSFETSFPHRFPGPVYMRDSSGSNVAEGELTVISPETAVAVFTNDRTYPDILIQQGDTETFTVEIDTNALIKSSPSRIETLQASFGINWIEVARGNVLEY